jgi:hypothetical protein
MPPVKLLLRIHVISFVPVVNFLFLLCKNGAAIGFSNFVLKPGFLNTITSFINLEMSRETSCKMSDKIKSNLPVANVTENVIEGVPKLAH